MDIVIYRGKFTGCNFYCHFFQCLADIFIFFFRKPLQIIELLFFVVKGTFLDRWEKIVFCSESLKSSETKGCIQPLSWFRLRLLYSEVHIMCTAVVELFKMYLRRFVLWKSAHLIFWMMITIRCLPQIMLISSLRLPSRSISTRL